MLASRLTRTSLLRPLLVDGSSSTKGFQRSLLVHFARELGFVLDPMDSTIQIADIVLGVVSAADRFSVSDHLYRRGVGENGLESMSAIVVAKQGAFIDVLDNEVESSRLIAREIFKGPRRDPTAMA